MAKRETRDNKRAHDIRLLDTRGGCRCPIPTGTPPPMPVTTRAQPPFSEQEGPLSPTVLQREGWSIQEAPSALPHPMMTLPATLAAI